MRVGLNWIWNWVKAARHQDAIPVSVPQGAADLIDTRRLEREIGPALARGEICPVYQPKLRLRTGRIDSVEALARWRHPVFGTVAPTIFIPIAEQNGCIRALTLHMLKQAIEDQRRLKLRHATMTFYINMSASVLTDDAFTEDVCRLVQDADADIGLEITETALIGDPASAIRNVERFVAAGLSVAIDDYGSGLSSLSYLKQLPASELKIDKLFISNLTISHRDPLIVRSTIDLAHALEMDVVAEGVETPASLALLRVMGCDVAQGFLISAGLQIDELEDFLQQQDPSTGQREDNSITPPPSFWSRGQ